MAWTKAGGGHFMKQITLGDPTYHQGMHGVRMISDFVKYCPCITSLSVCEDFGSWTKKFGGLVDIFEVSLKNFWT